MTLLTGWSDDARRSYCAYGVDLIRTGCLLLRTTPSVTYRAAVLFQRFQTVAEEIRCKRGDYREEYDNRETPDSYEPVDTSRGPLYTIPAHVGTVRSSGILAFGDPYAPLDYCVFHLMEHDDIMYLTAACVLIATKIEDPSTRIRFIVGVFMRLNQRRRGEPVIELLQPPPEWYDDFKLCVLEAEEVVLQALGFQTFVECPFKYAILFLGIIVEDEKVDVSSDTDATVTNLISSTGLFARPLLKKWLADAVCWLNDIPRSIDLYAEEAHVLALCALFATRPSNIVGFPDEWTLAFGLERTKLNTVLRLHRKHLEQAVNSENSNIHLLIATRTSRPFYPTTAAAESTVNHDVFSTLPTTTESKPEVTVSLPQTKPADLNSALLSSGMTISPANMPLAVPPVMAPLTGLGAFQPPLHLNLVAGGNQVISSTSSSSNVNTLRMDIRTNSVLPKINLPVLTEQQIEEAFQFEDLKEMRRRRRQEEEEEEERRRKRRRSSSRRRRHHSGDRHKSRSSSRRRDNSRGGKRSRYSPTEHKSHRGEQRQHATLSSQHSKGNRNEDKHRNEDRHRNEDKHRNEDRHRNEDKHRNDDRRRKEDRHRNEDRHRSEDKHRNNDRKRHDGGRQRKNGRS